MTTKLENLNALIGVLEYNLKTFTESLSQAREERKAIFDAAHTWTAADYRIVLIQDDSAWEFEDMVGEAPQESDSEQFKARYQAMHRAYYDEPGEGIYASIVSLQKLNLETMTFEDLEACCGLFSLASDSYKRIVAEARDMASDMLDVDGIDVADISVFSEDDVK